MLREDGVPRVLLHELPRGKPTEQDGESGQPDSDLHAHGLLGIGAVQPLGQQAERVRIPNHLRGDHAVRAQRDCDSEPHPTRRQYRRAQQRVLQQQ